MGLCTCTRPRWPRPRATSTRGCRCRRWKRAPGTCLEPAFRTWDRWNPFNRRRRGACSIPTLRACKDRSPGVAHLCFHGSPRAAAAATAAVSRPARIMCVTEPSRARHASKTRAAGITFNRFDCTSRPPFMRVFGPRVPVCNAPTTDAVGGATYILAYVCGPAVTAPGPHTPSTSPYSSCRQPPRRNTRR